MRHVNENIIFIIMRQQCWAVFRVNYSQGIFTQEMLTWLRYVGSGWQWCIFSVCLWQFWSSLVRCRVHPLSHGQWVELPVSATVIIYCCTLWSRNWGPCTLQLNHHSFSLCKRFPKYVGEIVAVARKTVVACMNDNAFSQFQKCSVQESWGCIVPRS